MADRRGRGARGGSGPPGGGGQRGGGGYQGQGGGQRGGGGYQGQGGGQTGGGGYQGQGGSGSAPSGRGGYGGPQGGQGRPHQPGSGQGYGSSSSTGGHGGGGYGGGRGGGGFQRGGGGRSSLTKFMNVTLSCETKPSRAPGINDCLWKDFPDNKDNILLPVVPVRGTLHAGIEREIKITANHVLAQVNFGKVKKLYQYEIKVARVIVKEGKTRIQPIEKLPLAIRIKVLRNAREKFEKAYKQQTGRKIGVTTDFSAQIYTTQRLEDGQTLMVDVLEKELEDEVGDGTFRVSLTPVEGDIHTSDFQNVNDLYNDMRHRPAAEQASIMKRIVDLSKAYNTMLKCLGDGSYLPVGRSLMKFPAGDGYDLGGGLVNWTGTSVIYNFLWKPYINIDIDNRAFIIGKPVLEVLADALYKRENEIVDVTRWSSEDLKKASKFLYGCKVRKQISKAIVHDCGVSGVDRESVSLKKFDLNGRKISVYDYYREKWNLNLQYKNGPCLISGKNTIPAELCTIKKGKSYNGKLSDKQTSNMIDVARKEPHELERAIYDVIKDLKMNDNPLMNSFGVSFEGKLLELPNAKVLKPPSLVYGYGRDENAQKRAVVTPEPGKWDIWGNIKFDFYQPQKVNVWGILVAGIKCFDVELKGFEEVLLRMAKTRGMQIPAASFKEMPFLNDRDPHSKNVDNLIQTFMELKNRFKLDSSSFVLVIIPAKNSVVYKQVKQASELYEGILTQCVVKKNILQGNRQESVAGNLVLKINAKLGGVNHVPIPSSDAIKDMMKKIDILSYPCMILGIDVTHPPPGLDKSEQKPCSFAAVTGSLGRTAMPYMMHVQAQEKQGSGAAEIVQGLDIIVEKMIKTFKEMTNYNPVKLIIYRDGVGEGQFPEVLYFEMRSIRKACYSVGGPDYRPRITFITVQKRHKTRFFFHDPARPAMAVNAPPGTLVDTEIVHPSELDFYLQSHAAIKGTARPTRYHMLWDDSDFTPDQIHMLTYYLCFMYSRCNRSVKIPAPTYYAHWAAARAKVLSEGLQFSTMDEINEHIRFREAEEAGGGRSFARNFPMHFI